MEKIAIFTTVSSDEDDQLFRPREIVLRRPVPEERQQVVPPEPELSSAFEIETPLLQGDESSSSVKPEAGGSSTAVVTGPAIASDASEPMTACSVKSSSTASECGAKPAEARAFDCSLRPADKQPKTTCSRRHKSKRSASLSMVLEQRQGDRWGSVAVLAAIAATVWLVVLAIERQPLDGVVPGNRTLRVAAKPDSLQPATGRSMR